MSVLVDRKTYFFNHLSISFYATNFILFCNATYEFYNQDPVGQYNEVKVNDWPTGNSVIHTNGRILQRRTN